MNLVIRFKSIPNDFESLSVNQSVRVNSSPGIFQRNIVIDATDTPLSLMLTVQKFTGATDSCNYGGLRMYHHVSMAVTDTDNETTAYIPYNNSKHQSYKKVSKTSDYLPICTNDSFMFNRKFHLDIGRTTLIFFSYNSMFNIDVTLTVYQSMTIALYNIETYYCHNSSIHKYIFNGFYIYCPLVVVQLTKNVPFILQWSSSANSEEPIDIGSTNLLWPDRMDMTIYHDNRHIEATYKNAKGYAQICKPITYLRIDSIDGVINTPLGISHGTRTVAMAESLIIKHSNLMCKNVEYSSFSSILTPLPGNTRCVLSTSNFTVNGKSIMGSKYILLSKSCTFLDATLTRGEYSLFLMEPLYQMSQTAMNDNWVYFYLNIKESCLLDSGISVYFITETTTARTSYYEFPNTESQFVFHDFGLFRKLQFNLIRFLRECKAYVEILSMPASKESRSVQQNYFKV